MFCVLSLLLFLKEVKEFKFSFQFHSTVNIIDVSHINRNFGGKGFSNIYGCKVVWAKKVESCCFRGMIPQLKFLLAGGYGGAYILCWETWHFTVNSKESECFWAIQWYNPSGIYRHKGNLEVTDALGWKGDE